MQRLALACYSLLAWLAIGLLRRKLRRRARAEPGYALAVEERFGHYDTPARQGGSALVWLHAVSLGETRAAAILVHALRVQIPGMRLLLTHGTATGRSEGAKLLQPGDAQAPAGAMRALHTLKGGARLAGAMRLGELVVYYFAVGGLGLLLENHGGQIAPQGWEFYAVTASLFLTLAFPGFVYRYLARRRA